MAIIHPSYLYQRHQIWYFRQRVPRHLYTHIDRKEYKISLKTRDIGLAKRRSIRLAAYLQYYFSQLEKNCMTKKVHNDEQFTHLISVGQAKIGDVTLPSVTFDLGDPKAEVEAYQAYVSMMQGHINSENKYASSSSSHSSSSKAPIPLAYAIDEYIALKRDATNIHEHIDEKSVNAIHGKLKRLIDILGDAPVDSIVLKDAEHYRNTLLRLPSNINKVAIYRDKTIDEIIEMKPESTMSVSTVKSYIETVSTFYKWCKKNRYVPDNPFEALRVRKSKNAKAENEERDPWDYHQLEMIFNHDVFTKRQLLHPHYYWLPLIGLFTGARMNEICQLYTDDIIETNGVHLFKITDERPDQRLKNSNSRRVVPIHSELIRLGFLGYVEYVQALSHPRLFMSLTNSRDGYSKNASNWFSRFRKILDIQVEGKKQDFHSFRHNVSDFYKQSDDAREVDAAAVLGHSDQTITFGRYGKNLEAKKLQRIIEQLDFREVIKNVKPWKV